MIFCQSPKSRFTCWLSIIYLFLLVWVQSRPNQKFSNIKKTLLSVFSTHMPLEAIAICPSECPSSLLTLKNHAPPRHFQNLAAMVPPRSRYTEDNGSLCSPKGGRITKFWNLQDWEDQLFWKVRLYTIVVFFVHTYLDFYNII